MSYYRVIPRDLFNESKLLKCLGQLSLIVHEGVPYLGLEIEYDGGEPFRIELDLDYGTVHCTNFYLSVREESIGLCTRYNSKDPYPLEYFINEYGDDEGCGDVFNEDGSLTEQFINDMKGQAE